MTAPSWDQDEVFRLGLLSTLGFLGEEPVQVVRGRNRAAKTREILIPHYVLLVSGGEHRENKSVVASSDFLSS